MNISFIVAVTVGLVATAACKPHSTTDGRLTRAEPLPPPIGKASLAPSAAPPNQLTGGHCAGLPTQADLERWLKAAPATGGDAGGLASGKFEWGAIVNREGELCAVA